MDELLLVRSRQGSRRGMSLGWNCCEGIELLDGSSWQKSLGDYYHGTLP